MSGLRRMLIIAEREFLAYASSLSFWVALAIGPALMAGALGVAKLTTPQPPPAIAIYADEPGLASGASAALLEAARLDGRIIQTDRTTSPSAPIVVLRGADGQPRIQISDDVPLSASGKAYLRTRIERDNALNDLHLRPPADVDPSPAVAQPTHSGTPKAGPGSGQDSSPAAGRPIGRFAVVMMLWLTLTGSLGMLLQAAVRERTNRALESLLSAAHPWEVALGKLTGVGAISLLVLLTWLISGLVATAFAPGASGIVGVLLQQIGRPELLLEAIPAYILGYLFFGLITIAVGAVASDGPAAQNLSRPMFAVLLAAFFVALAATGNASASLNWLIYIPPFAPFMLLLTQPSPIEMAASLSLLALGTLVSAYIAVNAFSLKPNIRDIFTLNPNWVSKLRSN